MRPHGENIIHEAFSKVGFKMRLLQEHLSQNIVMCKLVLAVVNEEYMGISSVSL